MAIICSYVTQIMHAQNKNLASVLFLIYNSVACLGIFSLFSICFFFFNLNMMVSMVINETSHLDNRIHAKMN